jgi:hypothetical protein
MKGMLWTLMAKRCDHCPLCRYAREKPDSLFGKMMALHGKLCPFWRAWQAEIGAKQEPAQPTT